MPLFLDGKVHWVDLEEILYLSAKGHNVAIQTLKKRYRPPQSLRDLVTILTPFGFDDLSKNSLVRLDKIFIFDRRTKTVFFDKDRKIEGIRVSRSNLDKLPY
jgi:DNA-binding LytR/AlgR family response regulator